MAPFAFSRLRRKSASRLVCVAAGSALFALVTGAGAAPPTKEECIEAHGKGQDLREQRQLARARAIFQLCASNACPALVQADCARYSEELSKVVPSLSFAARDERQNDLPTTMVYVDDLLVTNRLDDGRTYEVDPGKHTVRFVHDGAEVTVRVVVNQGEKARPIVATFGAGQAPTAAAAAGAGGGQAAAPPEPRRSIVPLVVAGAGAVAASIGTAFFLAGSGKVPSNCSTSTKECAAPPGDKSFDDAHSGVTMMNTGVAIGIVGVLAIAGGLVWYFTSPPTMPREGTKTAGDFAIHF
jgi:hypothetical protein